MIPASAVTPPPPPSPPPPLPLPVQALGPQPTMVSIAEHRWQRLQYHHFPAAMHQRPRPGPRGSLRNRPCLRPRPPPQPAQATLQALANSRRPRQRLIHHLRSTSRNPSSCPMTSFRLARPTPTHNFTRPTPAPPACIWDPVVDPDDNLHKGPACEQHAELLYFATPRFSSLESPASPPPDFCDLFPSSQLSDILTRAAKSQLHLTGDDTVLPVR